MHAIKMDSDSDIDMDVILCSTPHACPGEAAFSEKAEAKKKSCCALCAWRR